jgi:phosphoribosylformylglycinamidine synthase
MKARVYVTLKPGILDPQGKAIQGSLHSLGFAGVESVRLGKFFEISLAGNDPQRAESELARMCEKLLANTVIEKYRVELLP